jgi:hypothetical protein
MLTLSGELPMILDSPAIGRIKNTWSERQVRSWPKLLSYERYFEPIRLLARNTQEVRHIRRAEA